MSGNSSSFWGLENPIARWQLFILVSLTLIRGLFYMSFVPPWTAPDEPAHFAAITIIGRQQWPNLDYFQSNPIDVELVQSLLTFRMWEFAENSTPTGQISPQMAVNALFFLTYMSPGSPVIADSYPVLPHVLLAPISFATTGLDIVTQLYIFRVVSILIAIWLTAVAWLISKRLFPDRPQFWLAIPAFIVFLPTRTHIFASLSPDVFAIGLTSTLLLLYVLWFERGASVFTIFLVVLLTFATLFTKRTVMFVVLWTAFTTMLYIGYHKQWAFKRILIAGGAAVIVMGLVLGWLMFNPNILDILNIRLLNFKAVPNLYIVQLIHQGVPLTQIIKIHLQLLVFALITFWGTFGFNNINVPLVWLWGLAAVSGILLIGAAIYLYRVFWKSENRSEFQYQVYLIFIVGIILAISSAFFPALLRGPHWGPQARYYFPALIPMATILYLGAWQLFPTKYRHTHLLPLWLGGLIIYDALVLTKVLTPFFYG